MGFGFLLMAFTRTGLDGVEPIEITVPRTVMLRILKILGVAILIMIGALFIFLGFSLYIIQPASLKELLTLFSQYMGGSVLLLIGVAFLIGSFVLIKAR